MLSELEAQCRSLVPLNSLRKPHLLTALDQARQLTVLKDDSIFTEKESNDSIIFLLSGEITLRHCSGRDCIIAADYHWLPIVQYQTEEFSATALTDCEILVFDRQQLEDLLCWSQAADYLDTDISYNREYDEDADWMKTILNSNLFYKIPPLNAFSIFSKVDSIDVKLGQTILTQGEEGDYCYFIKEGRANVLRDIAGENDASVIAEISVGQCFGEDALIKDTVRNATVKMVSDGVLMRLKKDDFIELLVEPSVDHLDFTPFERANEHSLQLLDVRSQEEFDYRHLIGATHIPLTLFRLKIRLLDPSVHYLIYCNSGARSRTAAFLLAQKGFNVSVLKGGLAKLSQEQVKRYLVSELDDIQHEAIGKADGLTDG